MDATTGDGSSLRTWVSPVVIGHVYQVRVRTVGLYGKSTWRESGEVTAAGPTIVLAAPTIRTATGGVGRVDLVLDQADDADVSQIEVWRATVNNVGSATLITTRNATANVTVSWANTGLSAGTYYYWARSRDGLGNASPYSAVKSATAT